MFEDILVGIVNTFREVISTWEGFTEVTEFEKESNYHNMSSMVSRILITGCFSRDIHINLSKGDGGTLYIQLRTSNAGNTGKIDDITVNLMSNGVVRSMDVVLEDLLRKFMYSEPVERVKIALYEERVVGMVGNRLGLCFQEGKYTPNCAKFSAENGCMSIDFNKRQGELIATVKLLRAKGRRVKCDLDDMLLTVKNILMEIR